jgi:glycosyltransferase involved in cell wall biosynthesis
MGPPGISRRRLGRFVREIDRHPPVALPSEAPRSISIVVPCYGHADYVPAMFASIVAQTRVPDEVIFVDDHSPDGTGATLTTLVAARGADAAGRMTVIANDRNLGQAATLNRAIEAASSDLIMVVNDDDYLLHDAVESMLELFGRHPELALIGAHSIHFAGSDELAAAPKLTTDYMTAGLPLDFHNPADVRRYRNYNDLNMTHTASCYRQAAWRAVGGYRVDKRQRVVPFSDRDFQLRVASVWPVAVSNAVPFSLWRRDSSVDVGINS